MNTTIKITDKMIEEYLAGTLFGWLDETGMGLWFDVIAKNISLRVGKIVVQKQRGVQVWPDKD